MLRVAFIVIIIFLIPLNSYSVPALNKKVIVTQIDGSTLSLFLRGDEYAHYYSTTDSIPIFKKNDSFYYGFIEDNQLKVSDVLAHEKENRTKEETLHILNNKDVTQYIKNNHNNSIEYHNKRRSSKLIKNASSDEREAIVGAKRGLVVLVQFEDLSFSMETAHSDFYNMFNQNGYCQNGGIGSVRDYFLDQSYGKFNLTFDVVGPITLPKSYKYYGSNSVETGQDRRPHEMIIEGCQTIDDEVDFSSYDWDGDGEVDQVFFIYAGYGEHAGAPSNTIWPHESQLGSLKIQLDGVYVNTYACSCELRGTSGSVLTGIGTPCHEFSHCLGLPDLYDTDYSGAFGMSYWDVMDSGCHSGPEGWGEVPYGYSAYERWYAGWIEPTEISDTQEDLNLRDIGLYPEAYILYNEGDRNEYYILENHQAERWFLYIGKNMNFHGLMVTHVDYDKIAWENNMVNPSSKHQRMSIIPADNKYGYTEEDLRGDLFPGVADVTTLSYSSHQDSGGRMFNENFDGSYNMYLSIASIIEENQIINFDVINTIDFPIPQVKEATEISDSGYTANWIEIPDAEGYVIEQSSTYLWNSVFPVKKSQTIEVSNQPYASLNWLFDGSDAYYRVRGLIKGVPTEWSESMFVGHPNDVELVSSPDSDDQLKYYNVDGTLRQTPSKGMNIIMNGKKITKIMK